MKLVESRINSYAKDCGQRVACEVKSEDRVDRLSFSFQNLWSELLLLALCRFVARALSQIYHSSKLYPDLRSTNGSNCTSLNHSNKWSYAHKKCSRNTPVSVRLSPWAKNKTTANDVLSCLHLSILQNTMLLCHSFNLFYLWAGTIFMTSVSPHYP